MARALRSGTAGEVLHRDGVRLRVRTQGTGPGLLLIHGWALDLDMWCPQFDELSDTFRVIAFDRRGFGLSSGEPSLEHDIDDVQAVLDELELSETAIIGMSQGARVALRYALRSPGRISHLILDGPPSEAEETLEEIPIGDYREMVRREGMDAFRLRWLRHPLSKLQTREPCVHQLLSTIVGRYPGADLIAHDAAFGTIEAELADLAIPVLVINGDCDSAQRHATAAAMTRQIPGSRHAIVTHAGHLPNLDNAPEYNRLVREFLAPGPASPVSDPV